jgi:hypothetical protein
MIAGHFIGTGGQTNMRTSIRLIASVIGALAVFTLVGTMTVSPNETRAAGTRTGFGFNATLSGFGTARVKLTGGGSFDIGTPESRTSAVAAGGFRCLDAVNQGPLTGCQAGQGVRWDTVELLPGITFKCSGGDTPHLASTSDDTIVEIADFYRAGDGIDESFTSPMFVSAVDQRPDLPGNQNVWIAGVGCGDGEVHFSE